MMELDAALESLLFAEAQALLPRLAPDPLAMARQLVPAVARLSEGLTRARALLGTRYLDEKELGAAYLLYYLPANLHRARQVLRPALQGLPGGGTLRVLDVGSGPGTQLWALLLSILSSPELASRWTGLECLAVDHSASALSQASSIQRRISRDPRLGVLPIRLSTRQQSIRQLSLPPDQLDLITLGYTLNELSGSSGDETAVDGFIQSLWDALAPGGLLCVVEPGLKHDADRLAALRDRWVSRPGVDVVAPCTHRAPCPLQALLRGEKGAGQGLGQQWCHQEVPWQRSRFVQSVDSQLGLHKERLAFSHLVLRKGPALETRDSTVYRALSPALRGKGTVSVYVCGMEGLREAVLLTRHEHAGNEAIRDVSRGALVRLQAVETQGTRLKLGQDSGVEVVREMQDGELTPLK